MRSELDGYGEGFDSVHQTPDGEIYVSFWDSKNYSMKLSTDETARLMLIRRSGDDVNEQGFSIIGLETNTGISAVGLKWYPETEDSASRSYTRSRPRTAAIRI